jgi:hypothetical protein
MRDEKDVAISGEKWSEFRKPAGAALAAMIPENSGKWVLALRFI